MANNTSHLPLEIIEIILSKSYVKSLLRFKTVSKSWNILISDPIFVRNHHHQRQSEDSKKSQNLFLLKNSWISWEGFSLVKLEGGRKLETLQVLRDHHHLFGDTVVCFCEGVLLVTDTLRTRLAVWNPSTRTHADLKFKPLFFESFGLCHDPITDDFKVVVVDCCWYSVYSCKNKSWMILSKQYKIEHTHFGLRNTAGVCVDGASYWVRRFSRQIMYYDPRDDKFKILDKPERLEDNKSVDLVDLRGFLCLYCRGRDEKTVVIWTKGKGIDNHSWNKFITITNVETPIELFEPQCLIGNKILIRIRGTEYDDRLVVYSPSEKRFEEIEEDTLVAFIGLVVPYIDTLFFPIEKSNPETKS